MFPINYKFVKVETHPICTDAGTRNLSVLVLDKDANDAYWKIIQSFTDFLQEQNITAPDQVRRWLISTAFSESEAFIDLAVDLNPKELYESGSVAAAIKEIYNIPITWVEDDRQFCVLELADGTLVENELWK